MSNVGSSVQHVPKLDEMRFSSCLLTHQHAHTTGASTCAAGKNKRTKFANYQEICFVECVIKANRN